MKINLRFLRILPLLAVLCTCAGFWEFVYGSLIDQEPEQLKYLNYLLLAGAAAAVGLYWRYLQPLMKTWVSLWLGVVGWLMLESYAGWGTWLQYPHVFNKFLVLLLAFGIYAFHRRYGPPPLLLLANVVLAVLLLNLLLLHRDSLSLSAFAENERGFNSASAYLFVLILLVHLNRYLTHHTLFSLLVVLLCLPLILLLQHRSVWIATLIAVPLDLLLLRRARAVRFSLGKLLALGVLPVILGSIALTAVVLDNPQVVARFEQNLADIANADKQGTGSWRLKQLESYIPLVEERPLAGWRLEGFEVPMQFYDPSSDAPMWADRTGHHFHNFYLDRAFYFGMLGILLVLLVPFISTWRRLRQSRWLAPDAAALLAYCGSLVVFGTSYDWSTYHFGLLGLLLALLAQPVPVLHPPAPAAATPPPTTLAAPLLPRPAPVPA